MRPDPADLPARLESAETLDADGPCEAELIGAACAGLRAPGLELDGCVLEWVELAGARLAGAQLRGCRLDGIRGATGLRGVSMAWGDVLANAGVFAAACGVRVTE